MYIDWQACVRCGWLGLAFAQGCAGASPEQEEEQPGYVAQAFGEASCLTATPDFTNIASNGSALSFTDYGPATYSNPACYKARVLKFRDPNFTLLGHAFTDSYKTIKAYWGNQSPTNRIDCESAVIGMHVYTDQGTSAAGVTPQWTFLGSNLAAGTWSGVCNSPLSINVDIPTHSVDTAQSAWTYVVYVTARTRNGATANTIVQPKTITRDVWFDGRIGPSSGQFISTESNYDVTIDDLWFASEIATINGHLAAKRFAVVDWAWTEAKKGLCGQAARDRYSADGKWCSEFASYVYGQAGVNMSACQYYPQDTDGNFLGCGFYGTLANRTQVGGFVWLFQQYNNSWFTRPNLVIPQVGDYVALVGSEGHFSHSGIALGTSADSTFLWTIEGNTGEGPEGCVQFGHRALLSDGIFDDHLDGVGSIAAGL